MPNAGLGYRSKCLQAGMPILTFSQALRKGGAELVEIESVRRQFVEKKSRPRVPPQAISAALRTRPSTAKHVR